MPTRPRHARRPASRRARAASAPARAFTLLEVMIVILIILALAGLVTVNLMGSKESAGKSTVKLQLAHFKEAVKQFNLEFNRYPTDDEGLEVLWNKEKLDPDADAAKWRRFMDEPIPADPWGTPWQYAAQSETREGSFDISSAGPDKEPGTEDDISVWPKAADGSEGAGAGTGSPTPPTGP